MIIYLVIFGVAIALLFDFLNGMNDAANSIATIVSTKVLSPLGAVAWAASFNFIAYFIFGVSVAATIGKGIVDPKLINVYFIIAALIGAIIWVYACTRFGMPISVSHSLIGGLIGPGLLAGGIAAISGGKILLVLLFIVLSPVIGLLLGYLVMIIVMHLFKRTTPLKVDGYFRVLQLASSAVFSLGHGSNDAQKTMGIIWALLIGAQMIPADADLPHWVVISCYSAIALGTLTGGWKVIKTLGVGLTDLKPVGGFCAETAGAITVIGSSLAGIPVSTTHTITGSIMGVGLTRRLSAVRWGVAGNIVTAWVLTIPVTMLISMLIYAVLRWFFM
ncbi:inorganic phosphate transporter, PiT family [Williamwhitmania taraxaci]|uniref:Inorganic phosphate transporter, PiT family n=1 Tax=Williamwhitmania taraxaci TaxID=1640674 RepID=A0A1G6P0D5_9BACT|nr:inorganic phosphate transporter [Williamwhitmania taraxaci]SDC72956.1 inorganic phosphate transporter, PiT family [Williamwhitmania taraxaci]